MISQREMNVDDSYFSGKSFPNSNQSAVGSLAKGTFKVDKLHHGDLRVGRPDPNSR
jgi:hypothetical protein